VLTEAESAAGAAGDERKEGGRRRRGRRGRGGERGAPAEAGSVADMVDHVARDEVAASEDITVAATVYQPTPSESPADVAAERRDDRDDDRTAPRSTQSIDAGDIPVMAPDRAAIAHPEPVAKVDELAYAAPVAREGSTTARSTPAPVATAQQQLDLPPVALTLPPDSDLVLVETTHHAPAAEPEPSESMRPRRVRPPRVTIASEPLEIVETRKDESSAAP